MLRKYGDKQNQMAQALLELGPRLVLDQLHPGLHGVLGLALYSCNELGTGGNVVDEADDLSRCPDLGGCVSVGAHYCFGQVGTYAVLRIAFYKDELAALAVDKGRQLAKLSRGALSLDAQGLLGHRVPIDAGGVAPATQ